METSASTRQWIGKLLVLGGIAIFAVLSIAWIAIRLCFPVFIVGSRSMENTLLKGDRILVDRIGTRFGRLPERGEPVVFYFPLNRSEVYIHRIVGIPGDRLEIRNKQLYRNGTAVTEPYAQHSTTFTDAYRDNFPSAPNFSLRGPAIEMLENHVVNGELVVPEGRYFVMGDNRDDSADSRYFGFIERSDVIGRALLIYYSSDPRRNWKGLR